LRPLALEIDITIFLRAQFETTHMAKAKKNYEQTEFVVSAIFATIGLFDVILVIALAVTAHNGETAGATHTGVWETVHRAIQSFLLATLLTFSMFTLIRWYRHHDELLESLKLSTDLLRHDQMVNNLKDIVGDCSDIRQKGWPEFADLFLVQRLEHLRKEIGTLKGGQMVIDLHDAQAASPKFFTITKGRSFVTSYKNWDYWKNADGKNQLAANAKAIRKHGQIIRVFIIPVENGASDIFPSDEIILEQLAAAIHVRAISEKKVKEEYCRDVGVFFDRNPERVVFMSEWHYSSPTRGSATLSFEGEPLTIGMNIHDHLMAKSTEIKNVDNWADFKASIGNGFAGGK
jgi:hypothetical protein